MKFLPHSKTYCVSITETILLILYKEMRFSLFWFVTQRGLVVSDFSGKPVGPTFKGQTLHVKVYLILKFPIHFTRSSHLIFFDSLILIKLMKRTSNVVLGHRNQHVTLHFVIDLNLKQGLSALIFCYVITETLINGV